MGVDGSPAVDLSGVLKAGGWCGLVGNLLMVLSVPLAPPWPPFDASAEVVGAYFRDNASGFLVQAWVAAAGVVLLVPFAAALSTIMEVGGRPVAARTAFGAMLLFAGAFGLEWIPWIVLAMRPDRSVDGIRALYDVGLVGQFVGVGFPLALFFGAMFAGLRGSPHVPRWIALYAALCVPMNVVLAACTAPVGTFEPSGPIGFASIGLFGAGLTATSVALLLRARKARG